MVICASTRCLAMSLAALLASAGASMARADEEPADAGSLTRIDIPDMASRNVPGHRTDLTELSYRRWVSSGHADVGIGIGSVLLSDRPTGGPPGRPAEGTALRAASGTVLILGLRYRTTEHSSVYADASHVRGLGLDAEDRVVGKVGVEFKAAQSDWRIAYGGLGLRLAGDARMTVKVRRSGVAIYMRRAF